MPYLDYPSCDVPADEHSRIWRYLDLPKFISLLDTRTLYFARADKLSDRFEGTYPSPNIRLRERRWGLRDPAADMIAKGMPEMVQAIRSQTFLSCWHINPFESAAMWDIYTRRGDGIALQSTFARLRDSLASATENILIGEVKYIDYDTTVIDEEDVIGLYMHKRLSFAHERELRAITFGQDQPEASPPGKAIACDLEQLVDAVYISPTASDWFKDVVSSVTAKYGLAKTVTQSRLAEDPVY